MSMCIQGVRVAVFGAFVLQSVEASAAYVSSLTGPVTDSELQATAAWFKASPYTPNDPGEGWSLPPHRARGTTGRTGSSIRSCAAHCWR